MKPLPIKKYLAILNYIRTPKSVHQIAVKFGYVSPHEVIHRMRNYGIVITQERKGLKLTHYCCTMSKEEKEKCFKVDTPKISLYKNRVSEIKHNGAPWYVITSELQGMHIHA